MMKEKEHIEGYKLRSSLSSFWLLSGASSRVVKKRNFLSNFLVKLLDFFTYNDSMSEHKTKKGYVFYAVAKGNTTGIFKSWLKRNAAMNKVSGANCKGFWSLEEAE